MFDWKLCVLDPLILLDILKFGNGFDKGMLRGCSHFIFKL